MRTKKTLSNLSRRERQIMDVLYRDGQATAGDVLAALGDHEASAGAYRRILAAEPHRDDVRRLLTERYEALGRPGLALRLAPMRNGRKPHVMAA